MADNKDAAATKGASKPPKGGEPAAKGKRKRVHVKDPIARAWKILKLSLVPRKPNVKRRGGKKRVTAARKAAWEARFPKISKRLKWKRKLSKVARAEKAKVLKEIKESQPPKKGKAVKRPVSKESEKGEGPPKKKEKRRPKRLHKYKFSGVMKFTRPLRLGKKGNWKISASRTRKSKPKKPIMVRKEIGGDKNGGFRMVLRKKRRQDYPTSDPICKRRSRGLFSKHKRYTRKSLKPGTICILLAGRHKGKRVVLLKVLASGLLLVNGPLCYNGCPLRRISQNYVIATRTRFDLAAPIPVHLDDKYFKRIHRIRQDKNLQKDIFNRKDPRKYTISEQRKTDQKTMDKLVKLALKEYAKKNKSGTLWLKKYLKSMWGLGRNQHPHKMKF